MTAEEISSEICRVFAVPMGLSDDDIRNQEMFTFNEQGVDHVAFVHLQFQPLLKGMHVKFLSLQRLVVPYTSLPAKTSLWMRCVRDSSA